MLEREVLPARSYRLEGFAIIVAIVAFSAFVSSGCTHTQRAAALSVASTALLVADWQQTTDVHMTCTEENPIIGKCGERVPVNVYFPVVIGAHLAVGMLLPKRWREIWFATVAGAEGSTVWSNYRRQ